MQKIISQNKISLSKTLKFLLKVESKILICEIYLSLNNHQRAFENFIDFLKKIPEFIKAHEIIIFLLENCTKNCFYFQKFCQHIFYLISSENFEVQKSYFYFLFKTEKLIVPFFNFPRSYFIFVDNLHYDCRKQIHKTFVLNKCLLEFRLKTLDFKNFTTLKINYYNKIVE